ncbi:hypothetical protein DICVIV_13403 [Dictyocaulus viviparus]|uniref:Uncharacterized protein n=1 Tax=Dictyocaulus viviparus TaxID=29172 RepID=A0A0D8XAG9_DICVI|nr:hypothetical protein DICVIV_13403 [Dictyocaulus viviparus]
MENGHLYPGFYQKRDTGPLEGYPCVNDPGNVMKCDTSCLQAQLIDQQTGNVYTYRDCGTYLLHEFGREKYNLSNTQYAMILTDIDEDGNTWAFKFCNKEKCLRKTSRFIVLLDVRSELRYRSGLHYNGTANATEVGCLPMSLTNRQASYRRLSTILNPIQLSFHNENDIMETIAD